MKMNPILKLFWIKNQGKVAQSSQVILWKLLYFAIILTTMCCCTAFMHSAPKLVRQRYNPNFLQFATSFYAMVQKKTLFGNFSLEKIDPDHVLF